MIQVLLGLKDTRDDLVAATLHALADLVPLVGASIVMGTDGKSIFSDTRPKVCIPRFIYSIMPTILNV